MVRRLSGFSRSGSWVSRTRVDFRFRNKLTCGDEHVRIFAFSLEIIIFKI